MPSPFQFSWFPRLSKGSKPHFGLVIPLIGMLAVLLIAACGGDDPTSTPQPAAASTTQPAATNTPQPPPATATQAAPAPTSTPVPEAPTAGATIVEVSSQGALGSHLVDAGGMTLYLFTRDERNVSSCSGPCADMWPPLLADGDPVAGEGLDADRLGTIQREEAPSVCEW